MGRNKRAAVAFLRGLGLRKAPSRPKVDPVSRPLADAPLCDEPLTEEDVAAIDEAKAEAGPFHSLEDVRAALAARRRAQPLATFRSGTRSTHPVSALGRWLHEDVEEFDR